jgi:NAD(P)-dependent dehydrogenase (short-subunit alcohol dehydrogenase family)
VPQLDGKVALVTGGGRGLGRGASLELGRQRARVAVVDPFTDESGTSAADAVAREIEATGGTARGFQGSVATFDGSAAIVADVVRAFGRLDILVNFAGNFVSRNTILEIEESEWDAINAVHTTGHMASIKSAAAQMLSQGDGGRIITVSARGAFWTGGSVAYSSAKAAIMGLTASAAHELRPHGITVNCLVPSATTQLFPMDGSKRTYGGMPASIDMDPVRIGPAVAFLSSPQAADLTGCYLYASGGDIVLYPRPLTVRHSIVFARKLGQWEADELGDLLL